MCDGLMRFTLLHCVCLLPYIAEFTSNEYSQRQVSIVANKPLLDQYVSVAKGLAGYEPGSLAYLRWYRGERPAPIRSGQ